MLETQLNSPTKIFEGNTSTGTTIVAIKYRDGIILGADGRTSMGNFVAHPTSNKIKKITDSIYCCTSGSAADTQRIVRVLSNYLLKEESIDQNKVSVRKVGIVARSLVYNNPDLLAGIIIAGVDITGPHIYGITLGGSLLEQDWSIGGSGSGYIYSFFDTQFKANMTLEEGLKFVKTAVSLAIKRDNASGGAIRMVNIRNDGTQRYFAQVD